MVVSTDSINSEMPPFRLCHPAFSFKAKGFVTTATVSAPISLASEAMMGAAPVPVQPWITDSVASARGQPRSAAPAPAPPPSRR